MTSIVNFEDRLNDRVSNVILESLNRMHDAKQNGVLGPDELSKIIVLEGDLFANKIKQGRVTFDEIESAETFVTGFVGPNKDKYFSYNHADLDKASKAFLEGTFFAREELERRQRSTIQREEEINYRDGFKRL